MGPMQQRAPGPPRYATRGNLPVKARHDGEKGKTPSMTRLMPDSQAMDAERPVQPAFRKNGDCSVVYAEGSATFLAISRFSLRTLALSLSSLVFNSQLSSPPTCSTDLRPCVETRSFTLEPSASESKVTFCKLGRNVRLVLLLAWETLFPTCRPLPVSSQTRDMVCILISGRAAGARRAPPVSGSDVVRQRRGGRNDGNQA